MKLEELLRGWASSVDGFNIYYYLLTTLRDPLPPDELMLNLAALVSLHERGRSN